jgi:hypothetical protein
VHFAEIPAPHNRGRPAQEGIRKNEIKIKSRGRSEKWNQKWGEKLDSN